MTSDGERVPVEPTSGGAGVVVSVELIRLVSILASWVRRRRSPGGSVDDGSHGHLMLYLMSANAEFQRRLRTPLRLIPLAPTRFSREVQLLRRHYPIWGATGGVRHHRLRRYSAVRRGSIYQVPHRPSGAPPEVPAAPSDTTSPD